MAKRGSNRTGRPKKREIEAMKAAGRPLSRAEMKRAFDAWVKGKAGEGIDVAPKASVWKRRLG